MTPWKARADATRNIQDAIGRTASGLNDAMGNASVAFLLVSTIAVLALAIATCALLTARKGPT